MEDALRRLACAEIAQYAILDELAALKVELTRMKVAPAVSPLDEEKVVPGKKTSLPGASTNNSFPVGSMYHARNMRWKKAASKMLPYPRSNMYNG